MTSLLNYNEATKICGKTAFILSCHNSGYIQGEKGPSLDMNIHLICLKLGKWLKNVPVLSGCGCGCASVGNGVGVVVVGRRSIAYMHGIEIAKSDSVARQRVLKSCTHEELQ